MSHWREVSHPLLQSAQDLGGLIRDHADEAEENRRLSKVVVDALASAGLMRLCVPRCYGGPEVDPANLVQIVESLAADDGATGWCAMIAANTSAMAMWLPEKGAREFYADPLVVTGGAFAPNGKARPVEGGFAVTGRWGWGSGGSHCAAMVAGAVTEAGEFRLFYAPTSEIDILDTWYAAGLRGTASNDFTMQDVFVPFERSAAVFTDPPTVDVALSHFPFFGLLGVGVAAVALGIARRAIDEVVALATVKRPVLARRRLAEFPMAQLDVVRADALLGSGRAFLLDEIARCWELAEAGEPVSIERRARLRLAIVNAATQAAAAVDLAYNVGGATSVLVSSPLQRCFRDVHAVTQHIMVAPRVLETLGRIRLGVEADTTMI